MSTVSEITKGITSVMSAAASTYLTVYSQKKATDWRYSPIRYVPKIIFYTLAVNRPSEFAIPSIELERASVRVRVIREEDEDIDKRYNAGPKTFPNATNIPDRKHFEIPQKE